MIKFPAPFRWGVWDKYDYTGNSHTIDAAGEITASVRQVTKTGNIQYINIRCSTVSAAQTIKVSLQSVNINGDPSGTILGSGAAFTTITPVTGSWVTADLGSAKLAVARGDWIAVVLEWDSTVGSAVFSGHNSQAWSWSKAYGDLYTTSWTKSAIQLPYYLQYDNGQYDTPHPTAAPAGVPTFNSGSSPNECALCITPYTDMLINGLYMAIDEDAAYNLRLLGPDGSTVLRTVSPVIENRVTSLAGLATMWFDPIVVTSASEYYISLLPTTTSNVGRTMISFMDAEMKKQGFPFGQYLRYATRVNGGAWTYSDTTLPVAGLSVIGVKMPRNTRWRWR